MQLLPPGLDKCPANALTVARVPEPGSFFSLGGIGQVASD